MVGVMTLNWRKNVSYWLKKVAIFDIKPLRLFFSLREFSFSLIWTAKISLRSILTTVRSQKMKILSQKRNLAFELFYPSATLFQLLATYILYFSAIDQNKFSKVPQNMHPEVDIIFLSGFCIFYPAFSNALR